MFFLHTGRFGASQPLLLAPQEETSQEEAAMPDNIHEVEDREEVDLDESLWDDNPGDGSEFLNIIKNIQYF